MAIRAQSIDYAAGGFLRHRFLRTLAGAVLVIIVIAVAALAVVAAVSGALSLTSDKGNALDGLKKLGGYVAIAAASAAVLLTAVFVVRPRAAALWQSWLAALAARQWRQVAIGVAAALASVVALAASLYGAAKSSWEIASVLLILVAILAGLLIGIVTGVLLASGAFALMQSLWRRLFAIAMVFAYGGAMVGLWSSINYGGLGFLSSKLTDYNASQWLTDASTFVLGFACVIVALELAGQAWWQFTATGSGFRAARGWRPPIHHLLTGTRRNFGLPGFLAHFGGARFRLAWLYFLVALFNALIVASIVALVVATAAFSHMLLVIILSLVVAGAALYASFRAGAHFSRRADAQTTALYQTVREWDERAPVVFLRNFNQDAAKIPARSIDPVLRWIAGVSKPQTLDEILLEHATPYGPVLAIGDPRTKTPPLGAARIFVQGDGNEWQTVVDGLCTASKAIVMCPTSTVGVRWELDLLTRHDLYARTIYIANPELSEADSLTLFEAMSPGISLVMPRKKTPIAALHDQRTGWRVLAARRRSTQTYTVALNIALQSLLGVSGVRPPKKPKAARKAKPKKA